MIFLIFLRFLSASISFRRKVHAENRMYFVPEKKFMQTVVCISFLKKSSCRKSANEKTWRETSK
jgi:hypothetical protein